MAQAQEFTQVDSEMVGCIVHSLMTSQVCVQCLFQRALFHRELADCENNMYQRHPSIQRV